MVLLLTDVFLLLTQLLLWIIVGLVIWYFLAKVLNRQFLGLLVLLLLLAVIVLAFFQGGINDPGSILELLWRVISFPLTPFGLGLILLLVLLSGTKLSTLARRIILGLLILLMLGSMPVVAYFLANELEMEGIEQVIRAPALPAGATRVIVLLGRHTTRLQLRPFDALQPIPQPRVDPADPAAAPAISPDARLLNSEQFEILSNLPIQLTEHGDIVVYAAELYREEAAQGRSPLILVSAGRRSDRLQKEGERRENITEAQDIATMLRETFGVPESAILLDNDNGPVRQSAESVQRLLQERQINFGNQLMLVGSALSMNRSELTFRRVFPGVCIVARPTDFYTIPSAQSLSGVATGRNVVERQIQVTDVLPTADAFYLTSKTIQEFLTAFYYFLRGWIRPFLGPNLSCPIPQPPTIPGEVDPQFPQPPPPQIPPDRRPPARTW